MFYKNRLHFPFLFIAIIVISLYTFASAQNIPTKEELVNHFGFSQHSFSLNGENIVYYTYGKISTETENLILYLQGSDPSPQFSYRVKGNIVERMCWLHGEFKEIPDNYLYVVVEKVGFDKLIDEDNIPQPKIYRLKNSLDNRVFRASEVVNKLSSEYSFKKIIVYGHSEGAPVGAKLATVNKKITHLGFWAGNALPDFYDFAIENRIAYHKGNITVEDSQDQIDQLILSFKNEISKDSLSTEGKGYTNKRWWSYSEPPIYNLLKLDIPIFVQVATNDKSAPIESTYLIPLEFARLGKNNLCYKVCVGCDHSFISKTEDGQKHRNWNSIFKDFIRWTNQTVSK